MTETTKRKRVKLTQLIDEDSSSSASTSSSSSLSFETLPFDDDDSCYCCAMSSTSKTMALQTLAEVQELGKKSELIGWASAIVGTRIGLKLEVISVSSIIEKTYIAFIAISHTDTAAFS